MEYDIRQYRGEQDEAAVVAMTAAADIADGEENITTVARFRQEMSLPEFASGNNFFVAATEDGQIVGSVAASIRPSSTSYYSGTIWLTVHPNWRNSDLGVTDRLIKRAEAYFLERRSEIPAGIEFKASLGVTDRQVSLMNLLDRLAYTRERTFYDMMFSPLQGVELAIPPMPDGLTVRPYRIGADDQAFITARNEVWQDHYGGSVRTLEQWRHFISEPNFDPELVLVAETAASEIAGFCWCAIFHENIKAGGPKEGWVQNLGVRRPWRKQGLGRALLLRGLTGLAAHGMERAMLGVDSESITNAVKLYKDVGFTIYKERHNYTKSLS